MVLGRSTMVLGKSGLDLSGVGGQGEPGESHQESVTTNKQTTNQVIIEPSRSFESMVLNWLDLEFGNCNICYTIFRCDNTLSQCKTLCLARRERGFSGILCIQTNSQPYIHPNIEL